jgi:hypothetical protein
MSFTVVWNPSAESQLAEIWMAAADRGRVAGAANTIDRELRRSPQTVGESRAANRRLVVFAPLAVAFKVREEDRMVTVPSVRKVESRS